MNDIQARIYGGKLLAKARDFGELASFVRHALQAMKDRQTLVEVVEGAPRQHGNGPTAAVEARRHMIGDEKR